MTDATPDPELDLDDEEQEAPVKGSRPPRTTAKKGTPRDRLRAARAKYVKAQQKFQQEQREWADARRAFKDESATRD